MGMFDLSTDPGTHEPGDEPSNGPGGPRKGRLVGLGLLLAALALGGWWLLRDPDPEVVVERRPTPASTPSPTAVPEPPPIEEPPPPPPPRPAPRPTVAAPEPEPEPEPAEPTGGTLRVESDVPGAMVFLDREYLGETPLTAEDVSPGSHRLNLSLKGYEGYAETIEVSTGPNDVVVRFREVRLDESVDVVHKHRMGSCQGRLVADPQGIRYETAHKDAFALAFSEVEEFEVDYLKKSLRLKGRQGRAYNFTTEAENADPLFVFHQNTEKARSRLASGGAGSDQSS